MRILYFTEKRLIQQTNNVDSVNECLHKILRILIMQRSSATISLKQKVKGRGLKAPINTVLESFSSQLLQPDKY